MMAILIFMVVNLIANQEFDLKHRIMVASQVLIIVGVSICLPIFMVF